MRIRLVLILFVLINSSCGEDSQPKPHGYLALDYPEPQYEKVVTNCPFQFEKNVMAKVKKGRSSQACGFDIHYGLLDGTIFLTYQPVQNNLDSLLRDAQKLPLQHTIKADAIQGDTYLNPYHQTYGMFYEVTGDAASQAQFYLTDSVNHFLTGSVYFNAKPNFDSIIPAADYLKKDIRRLMETVKWQEEN